ncbi:UDP-glucosyltransferase 2-like [Wyeomyia smithii]|uniref:UDP-glucosyltransferase 2-like n=1 Tax=Wyeomyia smithii TaxID=174621 RepID=UPI00246816A3|nr:UDP-glucosyltransferase 2-like [Wyeomyia smithii]
MKSLVLIVCTGLISILLSADAVNILYITGAVSRSEFTWNKQLMYGLAAKGHNVTALATHVDENAPKNVHFIPLEGVYESLVHNSLHVEKNRPFRTLYNRAKQSIKSCELILKTNEFASLMNYPKEFKFDLIIHDEVVGACAVAIAQHKFHLPPMISATASNTVSGTAFSILPNQHFDSGEDMCFTGRLKNFLYNTWEHILEQWCVRPKMNQLARKIIPEISDVGGLTKMARIRLINANAAIQFPEPVMPTVIPVGGLHIQKSEALAKDLEKIFDEATNGIIYCSFGSEINGETFGATRTNAILNVMKQLSQYQFVWQIEFKTPPKVLPKNVHIQSQFPQNDILAQPKVKLFITESSTLNSQEAIWYGVPMIGIPFAADQYRNINYGMKHGIAKRLSLADMESEDTLKTAIEEMLTNTSYFKNAQLLSKIFRDQPVNPLDRAIWWVEWVLRNPQIERCWRPVGAGMCWISRNGYDVLFVVFATIAISMHIITGLIFRLLRKRRSLSREVKPKRE